MSATWALELLRNSLALSTLIRVNRWDLFSRALGIRSTKKVWNVSLFNLYILRRACFMDNIFALIFVLALILSGWFFEDACPYVMGSRSEHNRISTSSIIFGSSQGESRRRGCRYWSPSMLSSCFLTVLVGSTSYGLYIQCSGLSLLIPAMTTFCTALRTITVILSFQSWYCTFSHGLSVSGVSCKAFLKLFCCSLACS